MLVKLFSKKAKYRNSGFPANTDKNNSLNRQMRLAEIGLFTTEEELFKKAKSLKPVK